MNRDAWNSHQWSSAKGRRVDLDPNKPLIQHHCSRCMRDFVEDLSGQRFAVYVSVFSFRRLPDLVSEQWLGELCPGAPLLCDKEVRGHVSQFSKTAGAGFKSSSGTASTRIVGRLRVDPPKRQQAVTRRESPPSNFE